MKKVSIIVPIYNVEKYLRKCLNSLTEQTLKDIEIICVDDGSTDMSAEIVKEFQQTDSRIKLMSEENKGQSAARNLGIREASGEYLGFVDSDDWVDKDYFEKLYNSAKFYNADIACAGFKRCVFGQGSVRKKYILSQVTDDINKKVQIDKIPSDNYIWNKIYKREKWLEAGIEFPEGRSYEDIAVILKILNSLGKLVTVPKTYYHYRKRKNSTVSSCNIQLKKDYNWAINEAEAYAKNNGIKINSINKVYKKEYVKIFNMTMMKVTYYRNIVQYNLFGFIPFAKILIK